MSTNPSLYELQSTIDAAWEETRSLDLVAEFASRYPEHADELFAFADALLTEHEPLAPAFAEAAVRAGRAAVSSLEAAESPVAAAATGSLNLLAFLVAESGRPPPAVAAATDTPLPLLVCFSDSPSVVPHRARLELAARAERGLQIPRDRVIARFDYSTAHARAASRRGAVRAEPSTYEELLDRAGMTADARTIWSQFSEAGNP